MTIDTQAPPQDRTVLPKTMLCQVTIYIDENTFVGESLEATQRIATQFGSKVQHLRLDGNESSLGITIDEIPVADYASLLISLADTGIQFTAVADVFSPPPEDPFLIIHYKNAPPAVVKRVQGLINWIDKNHATALIGSVTELPNDRPEEGVQISFEGETP